MKTGDQKVRGNLIARGGSTKGGMIQKGKPDLEEASPSPPGRKKPNHKKKHRTLKRPQNGSSKGKVTKMGGKK